MKEKYLNPQINSSEINLQQIIALSNGDQTDGKVNDPDEEVDAGDALIHIREMEFENGEISHKQSLW